METIIYTDEDNWLTYRYFIEYDDVWGDANILCRLDVEVFDIQTIKDEHPKKYLYKNKEVDGETAKLDYAERMVKGFIKFDGCSDLIFYPDNEGYEHFCGIGDIIKLSIALREAYRKAGELYGGGMDDFISNQRKQIEENEEFEYKDGIFWFEPTDENPYTLNYEEKTSNTGNKKYEIWMEGFAVTGQHQGAMKIGEAYGKNFDDAVRNYMKNNPDHGIEPTKQSDRSNWHIWGCCLFDNEQEARKSFG